ncbi:MAG: methyltetrahydrofolate cobalamin methyltransferase [Chloroflexi bacterium]|nr:methyltetrahydrofolate cobalamin methyltransferase [Chloroflexota bacterium]
MLIVGESLNATIPSVKQAVIDHDAEKIAALARRQTECGAHMLDLNAAVPGQNEPEDLAWMVRTVQSATDLPLVLDSSSPEAIQAALKVYKGEKPILSSVTGEMTDGHKRLLALAVEHNCGLVGMCMDHSGISTNADTRVAVAERLFGLANAAGLRPENLYIDPLVMAIATDFESGTTFLKVLRLIKERLPGVRTISGLSNISFGMPQRRLLNQTFLAMQAAFGMDAFLVDVRDQKLMSTLLAAQALIGQDEWGMEYLKAYRAGKLGEK